MSGFRNSGAVDTDSLFMAYASGAKAGLTGMRRSDGVDLRDLYQAYTQGAQVATTGLRNSAGTDLAQLFQNAAVPLFTVDLLNYSSACVRGGGATAGIYLNNDGTVTLTSTGNANQSSSWGTPTTAGKGALYWVRMTYTGDAPVVGGGVGNWIQISAGTAYVTLNVATPNASKTCNLTFEIATDSGGSNIIDTSYPSLYVEWVT
jgi:hypothetical protein